MISGKCYARGRVTLAKLHKNLNIFQITFPLKSQKFSEVAPIVQYLLNGPTQALRKSVIKITLFILLLMKKLILFLIALIVATASGYAFDKYTIDRSDLPQTAQDFLTTHFPKAKVGMIKVDKHLLKKTDYDVRLVNGYTIEFSNAGKWTSVDCKKSAVPEAIIPRTIRNYVAKNYPEVKIVKIEKKSTKYEVTLSDDVELTFSLLGQFKSVKIDD